MITVTAAILTDNDKILIAKRSASDKLANMWEFPGGKLEDGESPEACLERELKEELGITTEVGKHLGTSEYHYDHISISLTFYEVKWIDGEIVPTEHEDVKFVSIGEMDQYEFAPADIPFVKKLKEGKIEL